MRTCGTDLARSRAGSAIVTARGPPRGAVERVASLLSGLTCLVSPHSARVPGPGSDATEAPPGLLGRPPLSRLPLSGKEASAVSFPGVPQMGSQKILLTLDLHVQGTAREWLQRSSLGQLSLCHKALPWACWGCL